MLGNQIVQRIAKPEWRIVYRRRNGMIALLINKMTMME
jgi:hypothetical protein